VNSTGVFADTVNVTANTGTITGDRYGINAGALATVNNVGTISSTSTTSFGVGIVADTVTVTGNTGRITAAGANGTAIDAITADVTNGAGGLISGGMFGINATTLATVNDAGTVSGTGYERRRHHCRHRQRDGEYRHHRGWRVRHRRNNARDRK